MATKTSTANPIATFYEAQTAATAEIAQAALNGMQRLQQLTLEAMRAGVGGQFSLAQSMAMMRDGGNLGRSISEAAGPAAEQSTRYQREMVQAIAEMNNNVLRASYSMMERMRDAFETATQGSMPMASAMPALPLGVDSMANPMAMVDSAMRQWHTAVQQMMEQPAAAMAVASGQEERPRASSGTTAAKSKRAAKRKRSAR
ncbi:MAG TPA: phasin family protein [Burkholderiaceae bacterium]|nr:phasin family protein [Burkholderiaceae bacterium]